MFLRHFPLFTHDSPSCVVTPSNGLFNELHEAKSSYRGQHPLPAQEITRFSWKEGIQARGGIAPLILSLGITWDVQPHNPEALHQGEKLPVHTE